MELYMQKAPIWHQQQNHKKTMGKDLFLSETQSNTKQISKYYHQVVGERVSYKIEEKPENKGCTTSTLIGY